MNATFFWHDYETFGADPRRDRPAQFAGLRTDADLNPVEDPVRLYCQPSLEVLPHPQAVLVTGITPQQAMEQGVHEYAFARAVEQCLGRPGTCGAGYNSIRFDDEVTRFLLYRNLLPPYEREWKHGNSRWDLIDVARACYALRPEGLHWPRREDGQPSFRLETLCEANDIRQDRAHDALSDVLATLDLARLIRQAQPRLYHYALQLRDKKRVQPLLDWRNPQPLVHVSARFPARKGCLAVMLPLAPEPGNAHGVICANLEQDPRLWLELDPEAISDRLFCPADALPDGMERPALKAIHANRCPFVAPLSVLEGVDLDRIGLDLDRCLRHAELLRRQQQPDWRKVFGPKPAMAVDAELALYQGFIQDRDHHRAQWLHQHDPHQWQADQPQFDDPRLDTLRFRLVARTQPENLDPDQLQTWQDWCRKRIQHPDLVPIPWPDYPDALAGLEIEPGQQPLLDALADWHRHLGQALALD